MAAQSPAHDAITRVVERQHEAAASALAQSADHHLDAVAWISAHVAVTGRVLGRAVRRTGGPGRHIARAQSAIDRELLHAVWRLDRRLTGDVHNAALPKEGLADDVRHLLGQHASGERRLLERIATLDDATLRRIRDDLDGALERAPTRPHPMAPARGPMATLAFWVEGAVDRIRDLLDTRHVPVPRHEPTRHEPGRWGWYAIGAPDVQPDETQPAARAARAEPAEPAEPERAQ